MKKIESKEPISITVKDGGYGDPECYINIDEHHYATIKGVNTDQLDLEKVRVWVEETYFSLDYLSTQYVVPRLSAKDFV